LTHSLEVSNIAKSIAKRISAWLAQEKFIGPEDNENIATIASTCALIHDLGNPPFGHAGEDAMRDWFKSTIEDETILLTDIQKNDFFNFEGNAQTTRLVSKLQVLADYSGLNLTLATLSASRKYLASSDQIDASGSNQAFKKLGYFLSEKDLLEKVENETGAIGVRHPITYIVEAADDIVYSAIDLEDALKKKIIDWRLIRNELKVQCEDLILKAEKNVYERATKQGFKPMDEKADFSLTEFVELNGHALEESRMNILRTLIISRNIEGVFEEFKSKYELIMSGKYKGELVDNEKSKSNEEKKSIIEKCKGITSKHVFTEHEVIKIEIMGKRIIHDLMDHFWDGIKHHPYNKEVRKKFPFAFKAYSLLSNNYRTVFETSYNQASTEEDRSYARLQLLADYICGMTDSFAKDLHSKLSNG
jgi:dGTPase